MESEIRKFSGPYFTDFGHFSHNGGGTYLRIFVSLNETYLGVCQTCKTYLSFKKSKPLKAVHYVCKKVSSWIFGNILNMLLVNTLWAICKQLPLKKDTKMGSARSHCYQVDSEKQRNI